MQIWQSKCERYTVALPTRVLSQLVEAARAGYPLETGSALFGYYENDGYRAVIEGITPIAADTRRARWTLTRGVAGLREFFLSLRGRTGGKQHYVGEWHSHPDGLPHPSGQDEATLRAIATNPTAQCPECILVIVAVGAEGNMKIGALVYSRARGRIDLSPVDDGLTRCDAQRDD